MASQQIIYWLSEHPYIVNFRWSPTQSWGSTWSFLFTSIFFYIASVLLLNFILNILLDKRRRVSLGLIPAIHSLSTAVISVLIFVGMLLSATAEIRETRWIWRRNRTTSIQWLFCFPLGTRPSGRVFFWSYAFYLSRFLHLLRTFFAVLRRRKLNQFQLFNQSSTLFTSFLWLEFCQSFQVPAILLCTMSYAVIYGYRFWTEIGLQGAYFPLVRNCEMLLLGCNLLCHFGVLLLHYSKGGCNGIGAWVFNSVLNGLILISFAKFHLTKNTMKNKKKKNSEMIMQKNMELNSQTTKQN